MNRLTDSELVEAFNKAPSLDNLKKLKEAVEDYIGSLSDNCSVVVFDDDTNAFRNSLKDIDNLEFIDQLAAEDGAVDLYDHILLAASKKINKEIEKKMLKRFIASQDEVIKINGDIVYCSEGVPFTRSMLYASPTFMFLTGVLLNNEQASADIKSAFIKIIAQNFNRENEDSITYERSIDDYDYDTDRYDRYKFRKLCDRYGYKVSRLECLMEIYPSFDMSLALLKCADISNDWDVQLSLVRFATDNFIKSNPNKKQFEEFVSVLCRKSLDSRFTNDVKIESLHKIMDKFSSPEEIKICKKYAKMNNLDINGHRIIAYPKMVSLLEEIDSAYKNNDKKHLSRIKQKIKRMNDQDFYHIDHMAMEFLVNNFTQENLEKVNNLRAFYGLKAVVSEQPLLEKNERDIRRMEFAHNIGVTKENNPHYEHTYSEAFKKFIGDYGQQYYPDDYIDVLQDSEAVKMLNEHGFGSFIEQLPEVLAEHHVPPKLVPQFYVKDLQYFLLDSHSYSIDKYEKRSIFDFNEVDIEPPVPEVRKTFWKNVVRNKKLVKFITNDLRKKGVRDFYIKLLFENAKLYGNPNYDTKDCDFPVFLQVHHRVALKDGGTNTPDNFVIVVNMPNKLNSHKPLHEWDSPLVHLYKHKEVDKDGIIISQKTKSEEDIEVRLNTVFVKDEENSKNNSLERVLYYGGPQISSMFIGESNRSLRLSIQNIHRLKSRLNEKSIDKLFEKPKNTSNIDDNNNDNNDKDKEIMQMKMRPRRPRTEPPRAYMSK